MNLDSDNLDIQIENIIINCLREIGIVIDLDLLLNDDVNLIEYQLDSLTFISFLVDVEERLNITIPDEYLDYNIMQSLKGFANLVSQLVRDSRNDSCTQNTMKI